MQRVVCFARDSLCFTFQIHGWNINMVNCLTANTPEKPGCKLWASYLCFFFFCGALHELLMDWTPVGCLKIYRHLELSRSGFSLLFLFLHFEPFCFWTEFYIFAVSKMEQMIMFTLMMFTKMKLAALIVSPCWCACVINVVFILFKL